MKWKVRTALLGIIERPDLHLAVAAHRDDKDELDKIGERALEAGQANFASTVGTALHSLTEKIDRGQEPGYVPPEYVADIEAYQAATQDMERVHIEQMVVLDDLKVAGTPDLVVSYQKSKCYYIADKKTGSVDYPLKMAAQLAIYSRGKLYNPDTGTRTPVTVHQDRAIILHMPARTGQCIPYWVDLTVGWEAVQLALQVRDIRKRKHLLTPFEEMEIADAITVLTNVGLNPTPVVDPTLELIDFAHSVEELGQVWKTNRLIWTPVHTEAAARRKEEIINHGPGQCEIGMEEPSQCDICGTPD
jgi:CBS domain-containing protein